MPKSKAEWALRFKRDANQYLLELEQALNLSSQLATQNPEPALSQVELDNLHELYRLAHTIKGSGAMVGQIISSELALQLEQIFGEQYRRQNRLTDAQTQTVRALIVQIQQNLNIIE